MGRRKDITGSLQITRATLLPMLCSRTSIKNETIPKPESLSLQDQDPFSPKISCIGQVKRNNKITTLPINTTTTTIRNSSKHNHYSNLKSLFSGKSLSVTTNPNSPTRRRRRRRGSQELVKNSEGSDKIDESSKGLVADLVDMDTPLPVVKKKQTGDKAAENLWKRRSGGLELRSLQIQQIQNKMTRHQMQFTTTV
ncbi:PREDICTED: uncharacterized protein LOC104813133 [Tarenaya hassleriana]|uniref:uncharacterized protein LOC104813133 n=1 Tax=Tarenaya hassleriana TaxID=28532 RepID=UPI00053C194D|nr:PREDICTED: uncharacterized protein LOC104813133 [Tarenaya hassleriana]